MNTVIPVISITDLLIGFIPAVVVILIMYLWQANANTAIIATLRMLAQLLAIGYVLVYIFESDNYVFILTILAIMLGVASWIAIRPLKSRDGRIYLKALIAISIAGLPILALVTQAVVNAQPWFSPRYIIPLAGMIFAGAMNAVSLAAERYQVEIERGNAYIDSRRSAFQASLIPTINTLFAVGLVSLPGMMTGQILSGVSPLIAVKYQIVVMTMLFGANGIAAAVYLILQKSHTMIQQQQ